MWVHFISYNEKKKVNEAIYSLSQKYKYFFKNSVPPQKKEIERKVKEKNISSPIHQTIKQVYHQLKYNEIITYIFILPLNKYVNYFQIYGLSETF